MAARLALTAAQIEGLDAYAALVRRWSKAVGLVSRGDLARFGPRHLHNSLAALPVIRKIQQAGAKERLRLVDLGSGAGLPGIPLAVALPEVCVTLVERSARKARFLNRARRQLNLANLQVQCKDLADMPANCCHIVTARALMPPPALWQCARPLLKPHGCMLAFDRIEPWPPASAEADLAAEDFPGGSIMARHWERMDADAGGFQATGLLVIKKQ